MIKTLQVGRALAALSVVAYHLSLMMGNPRYGGEEVFRQYTKYGLTGVIFFFVLSGFIIVFAHLNDIDRPAQWGNYIYRRFVRLFPIYWLYTAVFVALLLMGLGGNSTMPDDFAGWLGTVTLIRFSSESPPLAVAWTLFHELAFYLMFSLLILNKRLGYMAMALWTIVVAVYFQFPSELDRTPFKVYTGAYNLFFLFGIAAFWIYKRAGNGWIEFVAGLALSIWALDSLGHDRLIDLLPVALGFSLLLAGAAKLERAGKIFMPAFLAFIGDASYTIYLSHLALTGALLKAAMKLHLLQLIGGPAVYLVVMAAIVGLGCAAYVGVERPLLALLRRKKGSRRSDPAERLAA